MIYSRKEKFIWHPTLVTPSKNTQKVNEQRESGTKMPVERSPSRADQLPAEIADTNSSTSADKTKKAENAEVHASQLRYIKITFGGSNRSYGS